MAGPYTRVGFSYDHQSDITATATAFPCTVDATNAVEAANFPRNCNVQSIEFSIDTIASSAASIHMYLARDAAGDIPLTPGSTSGATQTIQTGATTATDGGVIFLVDADVNFHTGHSVADTIYVIAKTDTGTCTANIRVNWRK
jgi:hypothetical protein|tara:strand:+ start:5890 stop:6318 length:429 start_codon:yes stop_codon:yes gene_type:complete